ncbi:PPR containing protein [Medicago truncatula]|uniref:PPR containing protein n=1 Tax=Medicago truncatula TaxID=3880 RepID=A0A072UW04_MEDTR|nr:PPR containing protein [Medicago truncatula]
MIEKRVYPNVVTFKILIDALCKEKLLRRNVDNVDRIVGKRNSHFPSVIVNFSLSLRMMEKEGEEEGKLVTLLKRLLQKNLIGNSVAYLLIFHVNVRLGDLDFALEMLSVMFHVFISVELSLADVGGETTTLEDMYEAFKDFKMRFNSFMLSLNTNETGEKYDAEQHKEILAIIDRIELKFQLHRRLLDNIVKMIDTIQFE